MDFSSIDKTNIMENTYWKVNNYMIYNYTSDVTIFSNF